MTPINDFIWDINHSLLWKIKQSHPL
jgi:hypothetical protein